MMKSGVCFVALLTIVLSTISRTIAAEFAISGQLGASFFFKRGERDRGHAHRFFTTIAAQLSSNVPAIRSCIEQAIEEDAHIGEKGPKYHFDELVLRPLTTSSVPVNKLVFLVVDALDECDLDMHMRMIVELLAKVQAKSLFDIRILLTSRPELPLRLGFKKLTSDQYESLVLQEIDPAVVKEDFTLFFRHHFAQLVLDDDGRLPLTWPGDSDTSSLVKMAYPLFIFAATIFRFIADPGWSPEQQLEYLLRYKSTRMDAMDRTYRPVLARLLDGSSSRRADLIFELRTVLGPIAVLGEPLSRRALAALLGINEQRITTRLRTLHAVLDVPEDANIPVRPYHLSFLDFLLDDKRQDYKDFYIDSRTAHQEVAQRCLVILLSTKQLKKNICNFLGLDVSDHPVRSMHGNMLAGYISPELQYACCHWVFHLSRAASVSPDMEAQILEFLERRFLFWLEALSLLRHVNEGVRMMYTLSNLTTRNGTDTEVQQRLNQFISDAYRFVLFNKSMIEDNPIQTYASALIFAPKKSIIRQAFRHCFPSWFARLRDEKSGWGEDLQHLVWHKADISSISISSDDVLASADVCGNIVLWDAATGNIQQKIRTQVTGILSMAFSEDDYYLVSGSMDGNIKFWNSASGELRQTIKDDAVDECDASLTAMTISPQCIPVSALSNGLITIWDTTSGMPSRTIEAHSSRVSVLVFTKKGDLVSGSADMLIKVWKRGSYELLQVLKGHLRPIECLAASPDGVVIASGAPDVSVKIWNIIHGRLVGNIDLRVTEFMNYATALSYSPNGNILAVGLNRQIDLFETASYTRLRSLNGHTLITSLAFSSTGLLASGSLDKRIVIWKLNETSQEELQDTDHSSIIWDLILSPCSRFLVSSDGAVKLWDVISGELIGTIEGARRSDVMFSPDSKLLVVTNLEEICLYVIASRTLLAQFDKSQPKCFSSDSRYFVYCDGIELVVWDVVTDTNTVLDGLDNWSGFGEVSFSNDGKLLAIAHSQALMIHDALTCCVKQTIEYDDTFGRITSISISPDNELLAIACSGNIHIFDVKTGELKETIKTEVDVRRLNFHLQLPYLDTNIGQIRFDTPTRYAISASNIRFTTFRCRYEELQLWIEGNGKRLLQLPDDYNSQINDVRGGLFAFGLRSKRVAFLDLRHEDTEVEGAILMKPSSEPPDTLVFRQNENNMLYNQQSEDGDLRISKRARR